MAGTHRPLQRLSTLPERFLAALLMSLNLSSQSLEIACKEDKNKIRLCSQMVPSQMFKATCFHFFRTLHHNMSEGGSSLAFRQRALKPLLMEAVASVG